MSASSAKKLKTPATSSSFAAVSTRGEHYVKIVIDEERFNTSVATIKDYLLVDGIDFDDAANIPSAFYLDRDVGAFRVVLNHIRAHKNDETVEEMNVHTIVIPRNSTTSERAVREEIRQNWTLSADVTIFDEGHDAGASIAGSIESLDSTLSIKDYESSRIANDTCKMATAIAEYCELYKLNGV